VKIPFGRITATPKPIRLEEEGLVLDGMFHKTSAHCIELNGTLSGRIALVCDRCARTYAMEVDEPLKLRLSDRIVEDKEDLDIIEFLDGTIDVGYIVLSERNALEGDYHFCPACLKTDETLDIEL
jgi:uncharacterized metal-binding protein YceD (DUF177 family)